MVMEHGPGTKFSRSTRKNYTAVDLPLVKFSIVGTAVGIPKFI